MSFSEVILIALSVLPAGFGVGWWARGIFAQRQARRARLQRGLGAGGGK